MSNCGRYPDQSVPVSAGTSSLGAADVVVVDVGEDVRVVARQRGAVEHGERHRLEVAASVRHVAAGVHPHSLAGADRVGVRQVRAPQDLAVLRVDDRQREEVRVHPRLGLPRHPRVALRGEEHQLRGVLALRSQFLRSGGAASGAERAGRGHARQRRGDPKPVHGRARDVDQATVGRDVGLEAAPERRDASGALRPRDVVRAGDVDVVLPQMERSQVRTVQPERQAVRTHVAHPDLRGRPDARTREEPVQPADHAQRAGLLVRDHDALAPQVLRERGPCPVHGSAGSHGSACRAAVEQLRAHAFGGRQVSGDGPRRRGDHGDDGHGEHRGERGNGETASSADLGGTLHGMDSPQPERTGRTLHGTVLCRKATDRSGVPPGARNQQRRGRAGDAGPPVWCDPVRYLPWTVNSITSMNSGSPWFDSMVNRTKRTLALPGLRRVGLEVAVVLGACRRTP